MATVLVVDDDRVLSHLVTSLIRDKGHKVLTDFDAVQGLMQAKRTPPVDATVLDADAVLSKPLVPEELLAALTKAL